MCSHTPRAHRGEPGFRSRGRASRRGSHHRGPHLCCLREHSRHVSISVRVSESVSIKFGLLTEGAHFEGAAVVFLPQFVFISCGETEEESEEGGQWAGQGGRGYCETCWAVGGAGRTVGGADVGSGRGLFRVSFSFLPVQPPRCLTSICSCFMHEASRTRQGLL